MPEALRAALVRRGFTRLTAVQSAVLAADDGARDLEVSSQTGSGKTVALGFALAARLAAGAAAGAPRRSGPSTLLLAPTRELAQQVASELAWLFADVRGVAIECVTGGTSVGRERAELARRPAVVVGTPGRVLDHVRNGALDLAAVTQLVLDEADQMLDLGFKDELDTILEALPAERRTHLLSATFPPGVRALAKRWQKDALRVEATAPGGVHADIEHVAVPLGSNERYAALVNLLLLAGEERTLVFVRTREDTGALADKLGADGFSALPLNGDLAQAQRTRTLDAFRRGTITTLIATDVAARGLDVPDVTLVVHADPPIDAETYVHRSGRTGRAGKKGRSVILAPRARESRIRRLLAAAKVPVRWLQAPAAAAVRARQLERTALRVRTALAAGAAHDEHLELARALLRDSQPEELVAAMLAAMPAAAPREPFTFHGEAPPGAGRKHGRAAPPPAATTTAAVAPAPAAVPEQEQEQEPEPAVANAPESEPRTESPAEPPAPTAPRRLDGAARGKARAPASWHAKTEGGVGPKRAAAGSWRRFAINWGARAGADPRRILAHVCRRGGVDSSQVGAIRITVERSTFEVAGDAAAAFSKRVKRRDRRDPHLVIVPAAESD